MAPITVALTLQYNDIWQNCFELGHEMIIPSKIGKISPTMEFMISGLDHNKLYTLSMHLERADNYKYHFDRTTGGYSSFISPEENETPKIVYHPRNIQRGSEWMSSSVSFDCVRITRTKNLEIQSVNNIFLLTGHRYQPILIVYEEDKPVYTSRIEHMAFIVTSRYHKEGISECKKSTNKFSSKSDSNDKVGILSNRKRAFTTVTVESAKQSGSSDDKDKQSTSGEGLPIMRRTLSVFSVSGDYLGKVQVDQKGKVQMDQKPGATSESKESKSIKSKVSAPYPATPKSRLELMKSEMDIPRPASPAPLNTSKPIKVEASESEQATPDAQEIQKAPVPVALLCPARPDEHIPLPQIFPGFSMMPMMNMMPLGMFPYPDAMFNLYWNPMMLPTQPPSIPSDNVNVPTPPEPTEGNNADETEEEDVDIIN